MQDDLDPNLIFIQDIHEILLRDWDPLNIQNRPELDDEYDGFIEGLLDIFEDESASQSQIEDYLLYIETEELQRKANAQNAKLASEKIWAAFLAYIA